MQILIFVSPFFEKRKLQATIKKKRKKKDLGSHEEIKYVAF